MQFKSICGSLCATLIAIESSQMAPVSAQLVPEPWVTVGSKNGTVSYGVGVKIFDLGAEITNISGTTGVDVLKFFGFRPMLVWEFTVTRALLILVAFKLHRRGILFSEWGIILFGVLTVKLELSFS